MESAPNLVLVGPTGTGKTSIGTRLAARFGLRFADADEAIEARAGMPVSDIFAREGEPRFRAFERDALAELLAGHGQVIATGGGGVLDAATRELIRTRGFVVWLHVDVATQLARLAGDATRPLLQHPDRAATLEAMSAARTPLYAEVADLRFDTNDLAPEAIDAALAGLIADRWRPAEAA